VEAGALLLVQEVLLELVRVEQVEAGHAVLLLGHELLLIVHGLTIWTILFSTDMDQPRRLCQQLVPPLGKHSHVHTESSSSSGDGSG